MTSKTTDHSNTTTKTQSQKRTQSAPAADGVQPLAQPEVMLERAVVEPRAARPAEVLALQRKYGNRAVQGLLARNAIQPKLKAAGGVQRQAADTPAIQRYTVASLQQPEVPNWVGETAQVTRPDEGLSGGVFFFHSDEDVVVKPEKTAAASDVQAHDQALKGANVPLAESIRAVPGESEEAEAIRQTVREKPGIAPEKKEELEEHLVGARAFLVQPKVRGSSLSSLLKKANTQPKLEALLAKLSHPRLLNQLGRMMVTDMFMGMYDRLNNYKANLGNIMISADELAGLIAIDNAANVGAFEQSETPLNSDYAISDIQDLRQNPDKLINYFYRQVGIFLKEADTDEFKATEYFASHFDRAAARGPFVQGVEDGVAALRHIMADKRRRAELKQAVGGNKAGWGKLRGRGAWLAAQAEGGSPEQALAKANQYVVQVRRSAEDFEAHVEALFTVEATAENGLTEIPEKPKGGLSRFSAAGKAESQAYEIARGHYLETIRTRAGELMALAAEIDQLVVMARGSDNEARSARRKLRYILRRLRVNVGAPIALMIGELKGAHLAWMEDLSAKKDGKVRQEMSRTFDLLYQGQSAVMASVGRIWIGRQHRPAVEQRARIGGGRAAAAAAEADDGE